jgi:cytochrome c peroxidase
MTALIILGWLAIEQCWAQGIEHFQPLGTPNRLEIIYPDDGPPSGDLIELGRVLFFDARLSGGQFDNKVACATCHNPDFAFTDGWPISDLAPNHPFPLARRDSPSLYNIAWKPDDRIIWRFSLNEAVLIPIGSYHMEMPMEDLISRLRKVQVYHREFARSFPDLGITSETLALALAAYLRSLVSDDSSFDRYLHGDSSALSREQIHGLKLFQGKARCVACHDGPNFTDYGFHDIGIGDSDKGRNRYGRHPGDESKFMTPTLRNIALTGPYMHNGSMGSLQEVIDHYDKGGTKTANLDELMQPLDLSLEEKRALAAFMGALTHNPAVQRPQIPE